MESPTREINMAALNEQEEFEFRLRAEREAVPPVAQASQPAQPQEPSIASQIGRQAGRTGRMLLEGAGDLAGIIGNPISAITGARRPAEIASNLATRLGLPENVSDTAKLTGAI